MYFLNCHNVTGQFDIRNDMTGEFLISVEKPSDDNDKSNFDGNVIVTDASSEESWVWEPKVPKAGSDLDVWGFIRGEHGYLTATCGKRDNSCKVGLKKKFDKCKFRFVKIDWSYILNYWEICKSQTKNLKL